MRPLLSSALVLAALAATGLAQVEPNVTDTTTPVTLPLTPTTVPTVTTPTPPPSLTSRAPVTTSPTPSTTSTTTTPPPNGTVVTPIVPVTSLPGNNTNGSSGSVTPAPTTNLVSVQCPFVFSSAILSTQIDVVQDTTTDTNTNSSSNSSTNVITLSPPTSVPGPNPSPSASSGPSPSTATPTPSKTTKSPSATTGRPTSTPTPSPSLRRRLTTSGGFSCDAAFYGKWISSGLKCGGKDLDVNQAVAAAACATYKGEVPLSGVTLDACLSTCLFPSCVNDMWDYASSGSGLGSAIYNNVDFSQWLTPAMKTKLQEKTQGAVTLQKFSMANAKTCSSYNTCSCPTVQNAKTPNKDGQNPSANNPSASLISNWVPSTRIEQAAVVAASVSQTTVYASIAVSATTAVATSVGAVGSSAATASSLGAGSSVALNLIGVAQFCVSTSQLNVANMPAVITSMGAKLSFTTLSFLVWDGAKPVASNDTSSANSTARRLEVTGDNSMTGMERYALSIGIAPNKLLYVTIVGLISLVGALGVLLGLALLGGKLVSKDFPAFQIKVVDHAIGALVTLLIVSQYAIGVTATFEINRVYRDSESLGVSVFVAVLSLFVFAIGIMVYGYYIVRQHEDDIVDIGMKDHFEKKVHRRYGCLYDEYNYENRFFFVVKMLLALLCGMTTGMANWTGLAQVIVLMALNVGFVLFLEVRQPHLAKFVQQTTTLITIMKIASLSLTIFLLTTLVGLPETARNVVSTVILSLQGLVVVFLLVRQVFIFYRQYKLKKETNDNDDAETDRAGSITMYYNQTQPTPPDQLDQRAAPSHEKRLPPLGQNPRQPSFEAGKEYYL
ncbi:hypothetical protein SDRG_10889 [Saprolegnia diclina VS20]|uniref:TRP C-terminal domain-containing protein n=1 Tax=Saprolegnia diclina (strain VS20) TaxID=1156394 RepID=T0Q9E8_SAPDV|nr:hypothetical protein SDRG_10889 [Saprolegnia diclina VS20]EQC31286.1 hypothetical protein SDRG_10889 [Saprolegnia diclina VS20]|eukprot:XP_008615127.1 hypothetical protein SDRG_10889 [Saprolegnia diclina VS20]